ncbi:MAG: hypothetical protein ACI8VT_004487, partial [Saprospiraceae bacterium]
MKKINIVIILFCLLPSFCLFSQDADKKYDVGTISISLVMPNQVEGLSASDLSQLESKILRMLTSSGLSGNGYSSNFVIFPKFEILSNDEIPGMEKMTSVETELSLFVKQMDNNVMFSSYAKTVKGMSKSESQAVRNAIKKIPTRSKDVKEFLEETKGRIITYYQNKCDGILLEADRYSKTNDYEQAIATLMTIPSEVGDCYNKAQGKAIEYYQAYSNQKCAEYIQKAKAAGANRQYSLALQYLSIVDPSSNCKQESLELIQNLAPKVDAREKKYWDFAMKRYSDSVSLEKSRISAITEISK